MNKSVELFKHIIQNCKNLELKGLMTIGSLEQSISKDNFNLDFEVSFKSL